MRLPLALAVLLLIATGALSNTACSPTLAPIYSPATATGMSVTGAPYTQEQVEQAVVQGAMSKGWTIIHRSPGIVVADLSVPPHGARVRVLSNQSGWRIVHEQSSPSLKYRVTERHGEVIHRRYNHWIKNLDEAIRQALMMQGQAMPAPQPPPPG